MKKNIYLKKISALWLIFSLVFIIPLNSSIIFAGVSNEKVENTCGGFTNIKDSFLMSVVTMCIPGILEKTQEWKEIKCETAVCYYDAVKNNLDPTFCIKQDSYRTCNYIVGDIFALPGFNIFDYYREMIANALANPVGIILSVATIAARAVVIGTCSVPPICNALQPSYIGASWFLGIVDSASLVQQLRDIFNNEFIPSLNPKSACDRLDGIKSEMDEILNPSSGTSSTNSTSSGSSSSSSTSSGSSSTSSTSS